MTKAFLARVKQLDPTLHSHCCCWKNRHWLTPPGQNRRSPAAVCNGFNTNGLPLALQIGGRPFEDALVLQVGDALERALGTRARRPVMAEPGGR